VNDLEATAFGMLHLAPERFEVLQRGTRARAGGSVVVAAAGTGFGLAVLAWDGRQHHPRATEAGHVSFAPRNEREIAVLRGLLRRHERVSLEQVVSGPGLAAVHAVLCETEGVAPAEAVERVAPGDRSAAIAEAGLAGSDPLCAAALAVFCESYAAAAGDAALAHLALGGVWLGGGIAPKLLPALRRPDFLDAFADKGRFRPLVESLPLAVCLEPDTALHGAARLALRDVGAE
jgi:glucokinase